MSNAEIVRRVARNSREKETRVREILKRDQHAWAHAVSQRLALPGLRAFWPMSVVSYTNPYCTDVSGNGNHLTRNNGAPFGSSGLIPLVQFNGANMYLSHVDGGVSNRFDLTGTEPQIIAADNGMTYYTWGYFDVAAAADEYLMAKWIAAGNQKSYRLYRLATGELRGSITTDGATNYNVTTTATLSALTWYFLALQYDPSTKLSVWVGSSTGLVETANAAATPASIFDSTSLFSLGVDSALVSYHDGNQSLDSLYAAFHSDDTIKAVFAQERRLFGV